jgi:signal transduction histidine kinase/CheY-like chemotaxis protein
MDKTNNPVQRIEMQEILLLLAKEKTLNSFIRSFLERLVYSGGNEMGIVLLVNQNRADDIIIESGILSIDLNEAGQELKKDFRYLSRRFETNPKSYTGKKDPDNLAYNMTQYLNCERLIITPCYFDNTLNSTLILGKNGGEYDQEEIERMEQFATLLSFAVNHFRTGELNKALEDGLLQGQKLETIGKLASGMAHDFSNLLSSIFGSLNILKKRIPPNEEIFKLLDNIESCSIRARDLTRGLLSYGKPTAKRKEKVSLNNLLEDISKVINQTFPRWLKFNNRVNQGLFNIMGNGTEIYQVLLNLCVNAKEAMEEKGILNLSAENITIDDRNNYLYPFLNKGDYIYLYVEDTGSGITEENLRKIFDPYFSTKKKESGSGSGLGLYVTYGIIKAHDGFINVESEPGQGTKFNVYLPSYRNYEKAADKPGEKIIMLADDEVMLRDLLAELLESTGYSVVKVSSGVEALKVLTEELKIDLLIIDYNMPEMNGLECVKKIRELNLTFPIILSTGSLMQSKKSDFENSGIDRVQFKPYEFEQMLATIQELLGG